MNFNQFKETVNIFLKLTHLFKEIRDMDWSGSQKSIFVVICDFAIISILAISFLFLDNHFSIFSA